jgi:hypothetical protein
LQALRHAPAAVADDALAGQRFHARPSITSDASTLAVTGAMPTGGSRLPPARELRPGRQGLCQDRQVGGRVRLGKGLRGSRLASVQRPDGRQSTLDDGVFNVHVGYIPVFIRADRAQPIFMRVRAVFPIRAKALLARMSKLDLNQYPCGSARSARMKIGFRVTRMLRRMANTARKPS